MVVRGALDNVTPEYATGWIHDADARSGLPVQAMLNREIIGEAIANDHRSDLMAAGFGDGNCGYTIRFFRRIEPQFLPFIVVRPDGSDAELPRWSPTGFVDFLASVYRAHPSAGRQRSVFGGLWTDRTDSASLLKSRVAIGQISEDIAAGLNDFIWTGITVLPSARLETSADIGAAVEAMCTQDVVNTVQAVFDDHPAVLGADLVRKKMALLQASAERPLPSPAECLVLVAPIGDDPVIIQAVRNSHQLPEFNADGLSRWTNPNVLGAPETDLDRQGLIDRIEIVPGSIALIGPGLIHAIQPSKKGALRLFAVPQRGVPASLLANAEAQETTVAGSVRLWR